MLHRVARSRVLLFLLVVLTAFVSFFYYEEQQAGAAGKNVAVVRVAAAHATAVGAQAVEQLRSVLAPPTANLVSVPATVAPNSTRSACTWPDDALELTVGAAAGCRPFVGLLVPCTSAKTCDRRGNCWKSIDDTTLVKELLPSIFSTLAGRNCRAECDSTRYCRPLCECQRPECRRGTNPNGLFSIPVHDLVIYIGYDGGDTVYDTDAARNQLPLRFIDALKASSGPGTRSLPRIGVRLVRCAESHSMVENSNCLSTVAHADGAAYTYRVNDDTIFETPGWLDTLPAALKALNPPNMCVRLRLCLCLCLYV